jgi:type IX secretion system PorP/SprF family membrane protein
MQKMIKINKYTIWMTALFFIVTIGHAQINQEYGLYQEELYLINPAAINLHNDFCAGINTDLSNTGFANTPKTASIFLDGPIAEKAGIGLRLVHDSRGAFSSNNILGSYSYKINLGSEKHFLNLGLSVGLYWQKVEVGDIVALDMEDEVLNPSYSEKKSFINEFGATYVWNDLLVGVSAPYLAQLYNQYMVFASYKYTVPNVEDFYLQPFVLYQYLPEGKHQADMSLKLIYNIVWAGYGYTTNGNMQASVGVQYLNFDLGYAYKFNNKDFSTIAKSSHEIMLRYHFNVQLKSGKASYSKEKVPWKKE